VEDTSNGRGQDTEEEEQEPEQEEEEEGHYEGEVVGVMDLLQDLHPHINIRLATSFTLL
jgi:hypothetical protein